jgi:SAM-dependent methyltransferase
MDAAARSVSPSASVFAPPRLVTRTDDCEFYHTMDVPGYGTVRGQWDLRGRVDSYLGGVELRGKRVLELGTASGFLCIEMEKRGAEVVAFDLSEEYNGDLVPFARRKSPAQAATRRAFVRRLNNGWWLVHRAHRSAARVVYGTVYDVPAGIGEVDVATFGCILLHLRDPYRALASATRLVRDTVIVTDSDVMWDRFRVPPAAVVVSRPPGGQRGRLLRLAHRLLGDGGWWKREQQLGERVRAAEAGLRAVLDSPAALFLPDARDPEQNQAWWCFRPAAIAAMLGTLGFVRTTVSVTDGVTHNGTRTRVFTVVGRRG